MHVSTLYSFITKYNIPIENIELLQRALTHRSYLSQKDRANMLLYNEALEFLGDALLGYTISDYLFTKFSHYSEGDLTKIKAKLVSKYTLYDIAIKLELDLLLQIKGVEISNTKFTAPLANAVEALIAAVYLDKGLEVSSDFILRLFLPYLKEIRDNQFQKDSKSILQHFTQSNYATKPKYNVIETKGDDHNKTFVVNVIIKNEVNEIVYNYGPSKGTSKKVAEQNVALLACKDLKLND